MAQQGIQLDQEKLCCSICLDLLKQPVTIPCGHSYCVKCIESYWDEEGQKENHSCPQCRQAFMLRPVLVKNTVLADLVEDRERGVKLLQREIAALKKQDIELEQLEHTEDPTQFLHRYTSLSRPGDAADAGSEVRDEPRDVLSEEWTESPPRGGAEVDDSLLPRGELKTRAEFFKCSRQITLDPNTAHHYIAIDRGVKARCRPKNPEYPIHPDKFTSCSQVLSREGLTGRCYWEVKWDTREVFVAVAYKSIKRAGEESAFGNNDKSWALQCWQSGYELTHNSVRTAISGPESSRVGLYVDHGAGTLSFYSLSYKLILIINYCLLNAPLLQLNHVLSLWF
uniref:Tripartite motif-containing protein 16-like n=1 Tax=Scophthalmus maximus TaxID=52904 RepID=A0A8D3D3I5_SCOMX